VSIRWTRASNLQFSNSSLSDIFFTTTPWSCGNANNANTGAMAALDKRTEPWKSFIKSFDGDALMLFRQPFGRLIRQFEHLQLLGNLLFFCGKVAILTELFFN
jgi:hypothetical protein